MDDDGLAYPSGSSGDRFTSVQFDEKGAVVRRSGSSWSAKEEGRADQDYLYGGWGARKAHG